MSRSPTPLDLESLARRPLRKYANGEVLERRKLLYLPILVPGGPETSILPFQRNMNTLRDPVMLHLQYYYAFAILIEWNLRTKSPRRLFLRPPTSPNGCRRRYMRPRDHSHIISTYVVSLFSRVWSHETRSNVLPLVNSLDLSENS